MKKTLIALSLVALSGAASAEVILYGQAKAGIEISQVKVNGEKSKTATEIADFGSRIGFKGTEHLGSNLNAIWQVENSVSLAGGGEWAGRDSFIGLEGGFGKVRAGKLSTQLKDMDTLDPWEYSNNALGLGVYTRTGTRETSVRYDTPVFAGFSGNVQYSPRDNNNSDDKYTHKEPNSDKYFAGLNYTNSGFFAQYGYGYKHASYTTQNGTVGKSGQAHRVEAGYDANNLFVGVGAQYTKGWDTQYSYLDAFDFFDGGNTGNKERGVETKEVAVTGAYTFGNVTPRVSYAHGWAAKAGDQDVVGKYDQVVVGADYDFSKRTTALVSAGWMKLGGTDYNAKAESVAGLVGLRHKF